LTIPKINFCGIFDDSSGYGEFARYFVYALDQAGIDVSAEKIVIAPKSTDFGKKGEVVKRLTKKSDAKINVVNMIPTLFQKYKKPGCKNIGFTMWEATRLPDAWVQQCNAMDAIFVPCEWNKKIFLDSGVTVPVFVVQPGVDLAEIPSAKNDVKNEVYKFYSVFQWIERKGYRPLIKAYFSEFAATEKVSLTLKTYKHSQFPNNDTLIKKEIEEIRKELNIPAADCPAINLITTFLSSAEMDNLHREHDAFILLSRAEGYGIPYQDSMLYGNPTIGTNFSGNVDFMNEENSFLIPYSLTPTGGMSWFVPFYKGRDQYWAEPDIHAAAKTMRKVFDNRAMARKVGENGRRHIIENFNNKNSAKQFISAIEQLT
jgi:glycosyltransferase involved in cell wall biosynthesis